MSRKLLASFPHISPNASRSTRAAAWWCHGCIARCRGGLSGRSVESSSSGNWRRASRSIGSNPVLDSSTLPGTSTIPAGDVPAGAAPPDATVFTGGSIPIEGDDTSDEGYLPSDNPTARLSAYVDYTCGGSLNNPGPTATQPLDDVVPPTNEP